LLQKEAYGYAKVTLKKKKRDKESIEKNRQVSEILKQWVLGCSPKKREER
jgi:hypothetical protein